jgi:hypothetical protein
MSVGGGTPGTLFPLCGPWSVLPWSSTPITAQANETFDPSLSPGRVNTELRSC